MFIEHAFSLIISVTLPTNMIFCREVKVIKCERFHEISERDNGRGGGDGAVREINKASRCRGENFVLSSLAGTMSALEREARVGKKGSSLD